MKNLIPYLSFLLLLRLFSDGFILRNFRMSSSTPGNPQHCAASLRVAVIGAGISGSSFAKVMHDAGASVHVFEMGFGVGGRMATRKTRELPDLAVNHGAPFFGADDADFLEFLRPLIDAKAVKAWDGTYSELDGSVSSPKIAQKPAIAPNLFCGAPDMTSVSGALLKGIPTSFKTQICSFERVEGQWALRAGAGEGSALLPGRFDWLVLTSHTVGHPRWTEIFGSAPPLAAFAEPRPDDPPADAAARASARVLSAALGRVRSAPVAVAMAAYRRGPETAAFEAGAPRLTPNPLVVFPAPSLTFAG